MNSKKELAGKQLDAIRSFCMIKGVPSDLRSRILEYYDYLFTSSAALQDLNLFSSMPPALNAQLNLAVGRRLVARCPVFQHVTNASLIILIADMTPLVFVPGQMIVVQYAEDAPMASADGETPAEVPSKRPRRGVVEAPKRVLWAGSDGRGDGCAMGW